MSDNTITFKTYKLPKNAKLELNGKVYVGDPCYVFPGEDYSLWDKACDAMFDVNNEFNDRDNLRVMEINGIKSYWFGTNSGDGCYPLKKNNRQIAELGVDAGMLSFIPLEIVEILNNGAKDPGRSLDSLGKVVEIEDNYNYKLYDGDITVGPFSIQTS